MAVVEVRPHRDVAQLVVPVDRGELPPQHPRLSGRVHDQTGPGLVGAAQAAQGVADTDDPAVLLQGLLHRRVLHDERAQLPRPVQQQRVQVGTARVIGVRDTAARGEREIPRNLVVPPHQSPAVFTLESLGLHALDQAEFLHGHHHAGNQGFPDVITREPFTVEHENTVPALREKPRGGRTGGPAADHDNVEILSDPKKSGRHARPSPVMDSAVPASHVNSSPAPAEHVHTSGCGRRHRQCHRRDCSTRNTALLQRNPATHAGHAPPGPRPVSPAAGTRRPGQQDGLDRLVTVAFTRRGPPARQHRAEHPAQETHAAPTPERSS